MPYWFQQQTQQAAAQQAAKSAADQAWIDSLKNRPNFGKTYGTYSSPGIDRSFTEENIKALTAPMLPPTILAGPWINPGKPNVGVDTTSYKSALANLGYSQEALDQNKFDPYNVQTKQFWSQQNQPLTIPSSVRGSSSTQQASVPNTIPIPNISGPQSGPLGSSLFQTINGLQNRFNSPTTPASGSLYNRNQRGY